MGYILELRQSVGSRPLIQVGSMVVPINEQGQVLMIFRSDLEVWSFPSGSMELGDDLEQTARRELFEEAGVQAAELELLYVDSGKHTYFKYPNSHEAYNVTAAYLARGITGTLRPDGEETLDVGWFDLDAIPENSRGVKKVLPLLLKRRDRGEL